MTNTAAPSNSSLENLVTTYGQLSPLERTVLQLASVLYESFNRTTFLKFFNELKIDLTRKTPVSGFQVKTAIETLLSHHLLVQQKNQAIQCNPLIVEVVTRDAVKAGYFPAMVKAIHDINPVLARWRGGPLSYQNHDQFIRELRISFYKHDLDGIKTHFEQYYQYSYNRPTIDPTDLFAQVCTPFDPEWFRTLPADLYNHAIANLLQTALHELTPVEAAFTMALEDSHAETSIVSDLTRVTLVEQLIFRGRLAEAEDQLTRMADHFSQTADHLRGWIAFLRGEEAEAIAYFTKALQLLKKSYGKRKIYFQSAAGLFFVLALIKQGTAKSLKEAEDYTTIAKTPNHWLSLAYIILDSFIKVKRGEITRKQQILGTLPSMGELSLVFLLQCLCIYWLDADVAKRLQASLTLFYEQAVAANYNWFAREAAELLAQLAPKKYTSAAIQLGQDVTTPALLQLFKPQEAWELCLDALTNLSSSQAKPTEAKSGATQRLSWFLTFHSSNNYHIEPREQKITAKGDWSKGRVIALKRLASPQDFSYLTPQDLQVCANLEVSYEYGYYSQTQYSFGEKAMLALVGHPHVFWNDATAARVEIVKGEPELLVKKGKGDQVILQFAPSLSNQDGILVLKETPTRLKVIDIKPEHQRIAEILGRQNRLEVPAIAKERVINAISAVSNIVTVHSDIGGGVASAEEVPADSTPHIHLLPAGDGLKVAVLTRPFAQGGPYYRPGSGGETVIAEIDGKRLQTNRNLAEERKRARAAIAKCPTLSIYDDEDGEWLIPDPEACLELLLELQDLGDTVTIEWPEGEKMRVSHRADLQNFKLNIKRETDWFATEGELRLDDELVLDMHQLMELLSKTSSRFVPLANGQFVALTEEFRKRLDDLRAFADKSGKRLRLHPLAALAVEDWIDDVGQLKVDKYWKEHIKRLKEAQAIAAVVPSTLQAELRDYQVDGFQWLARLAHWGVGACLADDMGLGKTLQSLALILTRAPNGPTLIVAPTSVGMNWISESQRFAPTLNPIQFGSSSSDRQKLLDELQPFDLLVCSYGLLQQEDVAEMLSKVEWQTIVLDEAQSIKNFATKRSQAAMNLHGGFKLITTGTPIENHLGELWNLFRFINPGLLGSLDKFNQQFANPIERYQDKEARNRLKRLIQPFILRRTKNQVLQELPSRTEILLHVELSREELAFYEALRREALTKLSDSDATAGAKHLQVLAEIMKLRRACCNTRLVRPEISLGSAKLQLFGEVLTELLDNKHKALVFSQFVDHLQLIREYLDEQQINYQYLDGSTPTNERKKRVDAFQAGTGDVFLISLKAGGTGLNLTAADYVIHMDPWWNPAVEDQASDRAHRIGQQRPVTIYRLVAKGTIEEKIVNLHQHKRDLADSLLEGADVSGKISTDELLRLISEG